LEVNPKFRGRSWPGFSCNAGMFESANLIGNFLFGSIGFVAFIYGKRMQLWKMMLCGLALMIFPYFVENMSILYGIGISATLALFFLRD
jgi:hypothetical protein